jgi:hypothetical protein
VKREERKEKREERGEERNSGTVFNLPLSL